MTVLPRPARTWLLAVLAVSLAAPPAAAQAPALPTESLDLLDAVRLTLERHPDIHVQEQQLELSRGSLLQQQGLFDAALGFSATRLRDTATLPESQRPEGITSIITGQLVYQAALRRQLRSGLFVAPGLQLDSSQTDLKGGPEGTPETRARVTFDLTQPLLRGRGRKVTTAGERAAGLEVEAASADVQQTASLAVLRTVSAYWDYLAADRTLEIVRSAEKRFETLLEQGQFMVEADQMPAADLKQLKANLASRRAQRAAGEHGVVEARQLLGLAMGLTAEESQALPPARTALPETAETGVPARETTDGYVHLAMERRRDLQARRLRHQEAEVFVDAAKNGLRPQLDLQVRAGWSALGAESGFNRYFGFAHEVPGPTLSGGIVVDWPFANRAAEGRYAAQQAASAQARVTAEDAARQVGSGVVVAVSLLQAAAEQVARRRESHELFTSAVEDEHEKLRLGTGTVIDLIVTEDRLTQSALEALQAQVTFAKSVARLRYETGTLIDGESSKQSVNLDTLRTLPAPAVR
jgi:outer membrane protein